LIKKTEFTIGYRCLNNLKNFVKTHKDKTDFNTNNNIVYKICCNNYDASYVGQIKRHLKTRLKEHVKNRTVSIETFGNRNRSINSTTNSIGIILTDSGL